MGLGSRWDATSEASIHLSAKRGSSQPPSSWAPRSPGLVHVRLPWLQGSSCPHGLTLLRVTESLQ